MFEERLSNASDRGIRQKRVDREIAKTLGDGNGRTSLEGDDFREAEVIQLGVASRVAVLKLPLLIKEITLPSKIKLEEKD